MRLSDRGRDLIYRHEGLHKRTSDGRYQAYRCPAGVWTIYCGLTEGVREGMIITWAQGEGLFRNTIQRYETAVDSMLKVAVNQNQFDALVSLAWNIGTGALAKSTLIRKLNDSDTIGAAAEFGKWTKAAGKVMPGLVRRRADEAALFVEPIDEPQTPGMPQQVETTDKPLTKSGTIWGTLTGAAAAAGAYAETWISGAVEWTTKLQELAPMRDVLAQAGGNVRAIMLGLGVSAAVYVIGRRVRAHTEGKPG